jgi:peptidoglycan/LPS O-acetylase OafA/YrhL
MSDTAALSKPYFLAIDGFRLIASVNIVLFHLQGIGGLWDLREQPEWLFKILKGPAFHASIFFLLGGFIFTTKFADKAASFNTWSFVKKRLIELYPLHCVTTLTMAGLIIAGDDEVGVLDIMKLLVSLLMHLSLLWSVFPFGTYSLNRPSWALSAFFLCYVLFGPALRRVMTITTKWGCGVVAIGCMLPILLWTLLYGAIGMPENWYHFFHTFAPIRFFEFLLGMVLARFFLLSKSPQTSSWIKGALNDVMIVAAGAIIFFSLQFPNDYNGFRIYFNYHVISVPLYFIILFGLATERGTVSWLLSLPVIRKTGRSSFYPYLIHIPLISIITFIAERYFSYQEFLHRPFHVVAFVLLMYVGSYIYVNHLRKRKPSGPQRNPT